MKKYANLIAIAIIAVVGFAVYFNSIEGKFVWDDEFLINGNHYIKSWHHIPELFTSNINSGSGAGGSFYRPLLMLSLAVDYSLWRLDARGYHITTILFHCLAALALYWLVVIITGNPAVSFMTALLFAIHPVQAEDVAYITGRADSMTMLFILLSLIFYVKYTANSGKLDYLLLIISAACSLISKENGVIVPVLFLLYNISFKKKLKAGPMITVAALSVGYLIFRLLFLKSAPLYPGAILNFAQRIPGFFVALAGYARILVLPLGLHVGYGQRLFSFADPTAIFGSCLFIILLAYAAKEYNRNNIAFFGIMWFFISILPVSNIIHPATEYMAERYLYVPSAGLFLVLANRIEPVYMDKHFKFTAAAFITALSLLYSYLTIQHNNYWKNPETFYERTLSYIDDKPGISLSMYINLGSGYYGLGRNEKAIELFNKAIKLNPQDPLAYCNLALVYGKMGQKEKAIALYKKAMAVDPHYVKAYNDLGALYISMGNREEGARYFKKATAVSGDRMDEYCSEDAYLNLAIVCSEAGNKAEAVTLYKKAIAINPNYIKAYNNLGVLCAGMGNKEEGIGYLKQAIQIDPDCAEAYYNLGVAYADTPDMEKAGEMYKKAIQINPDYALAHLNLAIIYYKEGRYTPALAHFKKASRLGCKVEPEFLNYLETRK